MRLPSAAATLVMLCVTACGNSDGATPGGRQARSRASRDSLGARARDVRHARIRGHRELVENSAAAMSTTQPGVLFTINDSGNDPVLFALDTSGADRGEWLVAGATNVDWEAASVGPCGGATAGTRSAGPVARSTRETRSSCVYIGDVGDNGEVRRQVTIYRVREPASNGGKRWRDTVVAEALPFRYADGPHDVEAMYVAPNGSITLITKRPRENVAGRLRPALVFTLPAVAWMSEGVVVADLTDSLPIVPGSAPMRTITDAALSPDGRYLAVRTYSQVYVFAADSATGRPRTSIPPAVCSIAGVEDQPGEGVTWTGMGNRLLLTAEGRRSDLSIVSCPLPQA